MKKHLLFLLSILQCAYTYTYGQQDVFASNQLTAKYENDFSNHNSISSGNAKAKSPIFAIPTEDKIFIDFVGSGDIQKSISEGKEINSNTGLGIIFESRKWNIATNTPVFNKYIQSYELEGTINIATTADTIISKMENNLLQNRRNFGSYILNPISARQSLFINSTIHFGYPASCSNFAKFASVISGANVRVISSNNIWRYNEADTNIGVLALRAGIFHDFIPDNYRLTQEGRTKYSIFIGMYYAFRGIFGDLSSSRNDILRTDILGTTQKQFHGLEMNFGFRLNNLRAEFQMPMLKNNDEAVEGLTNTQFQFSIRFVGGFALHLKEDKDQTN